MKSSWFFQFLVKFSSPVHEFWLFSPFQQVCEFKYFFNAESHEDRESSSYLIKMHIQVSKEFSTLVIFRLSSCDLSPPLKLAIGGSLKVHKMSYTHPNSIPSVFMSYMRKREEMRKNLFWYFWVDWL